MSFRCPRCKKGEPLYKCPTCGATAHIDKKKREIVVHIPPFKPPRPEPFKAPVTMTFPSHFDCELAKPVDQIDLKKLEKVEVK